MIRLFTGLPGAGKTAHAVAVALELMQEGRPVYVSNMAGMSIPGAIPFDDPRQWEDLPANAVLIVDEAQRFWRASRSLDVPPEVQAMETHRHLGIDFLLTTQQPTYLLKHLRGLVGQHVHHLRRTNGSAQTWTWNSVCDDPDSLSERDRADVSMFVYPKHVFGLYKSTESDTHRPGIPRKWKFVMAVGALLLAMVVFGPGYLKSKTIQASSTKSESAEGPSAEPPGRGGFASVKGAPLTSEEFTYLMQPRLPGAPWSAPVFDDRRPVAQPELYCISSAAGLDAAGEWREGSQHCITEQGTRYELDAITIRKLAREGMYNPYRQAPVQQPQQVMPLPGAGQSPAVMAAPAAAVAATGVGGSIGDVAAYGADGLGAY